jgi:hypothetical protein
MSGYRRNYGRGYRRPTVGRVGRVNRRPGDCRTCGELIPAGAGELYREVDGWAVVHTEPAQGGWLMDPQPVTGGCPVDTDKQNAESHARGFFGKDAPAPRSERDRIASIAARFAEQTASEPARTPARSGKYAYTSSGARVTARSGRCEDAPCCGCCD